MENNRLLASLAVFGELCENKKSIHEILAEFVLSIIKDDALHEFTIQDIRKLLESRYDFSIPSPVIKTAINKTKLFNLNQGFYKLKDIEILNKYHTLEHKEQIEINNNIISSLFYFIKENKGIKLNIDQKREIEKEFCDLILDKTIEKGYSDLISAYILKNMSDVNFCKEMNKIREGVILYTGLSYTPSSDFFKPWKNKFTIYLNTEHIFDFTGFNGELYQTLFSDFMKLIKEVNKNKKIIYLKYFPEIKDEIENFFKKAERIVNGYDTLDTNNAMKHIVTGCSTTMNVVEKKIKFFNLIEHNAILEETELPSFNDEDNHKYNIDSNELSMQMQLDHEYDDISNEMKLLNYVSIKRGDRDKKNIENVGYMILTGKHKILTISQSEFVKDKYCVPLANTLNFMTNKLWFKLNKGFGGNQYPKSFSIITKAQLLLSSHLNTVLHQDFEKLKDKVAKKELNEGEATNMLADIRVKNLSPENVTENNIDFVLSTLTEGKVAKYSDEKRIYKELAEDREKKNRTLSTSNTSLREINNLLKIELERKNDIYIEEKKLQISKIEDSRNKIKLKIGKKYSLILKSIGFLYIVLFIILIILSIKLTWDVMEMYVFFIMAIPAVVLFAISTIKGYGIDFYKFIEQKKDNEIEKTFKVEKCCNNELQSLKEDIEEVS